ncbi:MAG: HPr family phosphocarrier protein [Lachnospiraceae bacterium]|nr:HPr family phosphocarrier protein [Lachnospiraceae bacterium]
MVERKVRVVNEKGLHMRVAGSFCEQALKFKSVIEIHLDSDKILNAKSMLSILSGGIVKGQEITIRCKGVDEEEALETICGYIAKGFGEKKENS